MANQPSPGSANRGACCGNAPQAKVDQRPVFDRKLKVHRPRKSHKKTRFL